MSFYVTAAIPTDINTQGVSGRQSREKEPASEAIDAGDLVVIESGATRLMAPADANVLILRLAEEKNFGVRELQAYTEATVLQGYEIGDPVENYIPSQNVIWGVNVRNDGGVDLDLVAGQKLTFSSTTNGKLEPAGTIAATTVIGTIPFQVAHDTTVAPTDSALAPCFYIGQ